jgi:hypothetical protein
MGKVQKQTEGFAAIEALIVACVVVVITLIVFFVIHANHKTTPPVSSTTTATTTPATTKSTASYATLSPATVPSKAPECTQALTFSSDGDSSPIQCSNGDLNVTEWNTLGAFEAKVMTLGYAATSTQVRAALCSDVNANVSNAIEETIYQITSLYYGWHFSSNPSVVITNGTCVNVDD